MALSRAPDQSFEVGWPVMRSDGLDDLRRFLADRPFRQRFRLPGGQFGICFRDDSSGVCVALRDPSATIPLHAHYDGTRWLVSPLVSSIEAHVRRRFPMRLDVLKELHQTATIRPDESLYEETIMLSPGVVYLFGPGERIERQSVPVEWPVPGFVAADRWASPEAMARELVTGIRSAVVDAARSEDAVVQLSGGLDSNLVLHAGDRSGLSLTASGMTFPGLDCDESTQMVNSCAMLAVPFEPVDYAGRNYDDWRDELFEAAEYVPFTTAFMALDIARRMSGRSERVLLNGMGGDEIFATRPAAASGFLGRYLGSRTPVNLWMKKPKQWIRGVLRRAVSGRELALAPYLRSGGAHFQMALVQLVDSEGVDYRMPFCDWRVVVRARALNALYAASTGDEQRSLQRAALEEFSSGLSAIVGRAKVTFGAVGSAETDEPTSFLGPVRFPIMERLVPEFIAFKQTQGRPAR